MAISGAPYILIAVIVWSVWAYIALQVSQDNFVVGVATLALGTLPIGAVLASYLFYVWRKILLGRKLIFNHQHQTLEILTPVVELRKATTFRKKIIPVAQLQRVQVRETDERDLILTYQENNQQTSYTMDATGLGPNSHIAFAFKKIGVPVSVVTSDADIDGQRIHPQRFSRLKDVGALFLIIVGIYTVGGLLVILFEQHIFK